MSDHLSPEQEDPEQRIRELERGLADTPRPAPQYRAPLPDYGVSPTAGQAPAWSSVPSPSGNPDPPTFRSGGGGRRWIGMLAGFVVPVAVLIVFVVPWKEFGFLEGLFGPTEVPQGGSLVVNDSDEVKTIECNDGRLTLNGRNLQVTVTGHCADLFVNGWDHYVTVDSADSIRVNGGNTVVVYHSGEPAISKNGDVQVSRG
jgi:hypothetical protein